MKTILMANDLSARSDRALRRAVCLAGQLGVGLEVFTVIEEMFVQAATEDSKARAQQALVAQLAAVPEAVDAAISQRVVVGRDYEDIILRANDLEAGLIVLGIHRHRTRALFRGTTAERVIRYGSRPVLVVRSPVTGPYKKVLVATDLSQHAEAAARAAAQLAAPGGEVILFHALHRPFAGFLGGGDQAAQLEKTRSRADVVLRDLARRLADELGEGAPRFEVRTNEGEVPSAILGAIAELGPDLVALGTHSRSGIDYALIGSVAEDLLADGPVDILVAKAALA